LSLLRAGLAWHYVRYDQSEVYAAAEATAKAAKRGLWRDPRPVAPWDWRKLPKAERDEVRRAVAGVPDSD